MLSLLHIENIALIESADIRFEAGFNVLTGETGAGKSIIIDSIGAVLGERTSRELIRTGAKSARVWAVFTQLPKLPLLEQYQISQEIGELQLQREIQGDGRNLCRVNGKPVTVAQLRELGRHLLNIHGQHDGQQLLDAATHLGYLDGFGHHQPLLEPYKAQYSVVTGLRRKIASLQMDEAERVRRIDTLTYQIGELERADLKAGEEEELEARRTLLRSAGRLMQGVQGADFALSGDETRQGACALLADAVGSLDSLSDVSTDLKELADKLRAIQEAADEIAEAVRDVERSVDLNSNELDEVETRLDILYRLKKKYGSTTEEMLQYLEQCRQELDQIQVADDTMQRLEQKLAAEKQELVQQAQALSQARRQAADSLQRRVQEELRQLDMPKVQFQVEFSPKGGELGMDETGMDEVQFLMSANVGEGLKPIQKVASGGELSRVMLALKNVLAADDEVGSLVFDEVDTGVSGRAAQKVAEKMAQVAQLKQVLCVTHLPQIAAMADSHFAVSKGEKEGRTYTQMVQLAEPERSEAIARLFGGTALTPALLEGAQELLSHAQQWREQISR